MLLELCANSTCKGAQIVVGNDDFKDNKKSRRVKIMRSDREC